jgi:hypothetical protein
MFYLVYFSSTDLFQALDGQTEFDAVAAAAQAAGNEVTILVIHAPWPETEGGDETDSDTAGESGEMQIKIVCISRAAISAEQEEHIEQAAITFLVQQETLVATEDRGCLCVWHRVSAA